MSNSIVFDTDDISIVSNQYYFPLNAKTKQHPCILTVLGWNDCKMNLIQYNH